MKKKMHQNLECGKDYEKSAVSWCVEYSEPNTLPGQKKLAIWI